MSSHVTLLPLSARLPRQQVKQRKRAGVPPGPSWDGTPEFLGAPRSPHICFPERVVPRAPQWWGSNMEFYEWGVLGGSPGPPNGDWYPKWLPRSLGSPTLLSFQPGSGGRPVGQEVAVRS